jgi:hypothetical protein
MSEFFCVLEQNFFRSEIIRRRLQGFIQDGNSHAGAFRVFSGAQIFGFDEKLPWGEQQ